MGRLSASARLERLIAQALRAVINQRPQGASAGRLYFLFADLITRSDFERIMTLLVEAGWITQRGARYFPRERAQDAQVP